MKIESEQSGPRSTTHFGVNVRAGKYGLNISRESYASRSKRRTTWFPREDCPELWDAQDPFFEDPDHRIYTDEWCEIQQAQALENYDLNMAYFASLDHDDFDGAIEKAVSTRPRLQEVHDLNEWRGVGGNYIMVLDQFCQAYVGETSETVGIEKRIRQHWRNRRAFDRLVFGEVETSKISVDSFRCLDTTRIFARSDIGGLELEDGIMDRLPAKYLLNRVAGGPIEMIGARRGIRLADVLVRRLRDGFAGTE